MSLPPEELLFHLSQGSLDWVSIRLSEVKVKRGSRLGFFQNPVLKLGLPSFSSNHFWIARLICNKQPRKT